MLFTSEEITNAKKIRNYFINKGWTLQAICGMLGNFVIESYLNPTQWEIGMPEWGLETGYGIAQWTPATKLTDWCKSENIPYYDLISQCAYIQYEMTHNKQFFPSYDYNLTATEYMTSTKSAYTLGLVWLSNYERPNNPYQPIRGELSQQWYKLLSNTISSITYTVKLGNTLSEIAEKYNVTVDNLKQWNNISNSNIIYPGQILKIY